MRPVAWAATVGEHCLTALLLPRILSVNNINQCSTFRWATERFFNIEVCHRNVSYGNRRTLSRVQRDSQRGSQMCCSRANDHSERAKLNCKLKNANLLHRKQYTVYSNTIASMAPCFLCNTFSSKSWRFFWVVLGPSATLLTTHLTLNRQPARNFAGVQLTMKLFSSHL